ncbi:MAG: hypothetical protein ABIH42_00840 [Planctomycetota bacterium]
MKLLALLSILAVVLIIGCTSEIASEGGTAAAAEEPTAEEVESDLDTAELDEIESDLDLIILE